VIFVRTIISHSPFDNVRDANTGGPKLPQNNRKISQTVEGIRGSAKFLNRVLASDLSILG
jgi:hypothetical protein